MQQSETTARPAPGWPPYPLLTERFSGAGGLRRMGSLFSVTCTAPEPERWTASLIGRAFGHTTLSLLDTAPQTTVRSAEQSRAGGSRVFLTFSLDADVSLRMAGHWAQRRPGIPSVARSDRPFVVRTDRRDRQVTLGVDLDVLRPPPGSLVRSIGRPLALTPLTRSTISFLRTMAGQLGSDGLEPAEVDTTLLEMFRSVLAEAGRPDRARHEREAAERARIRAFVEARLADPDLRVETLADFLGTSVRYVHRLFEAEDLSAAQVIRDARMTRALRLLADHRRQLSLAEVAGLVGFRGRDQFARAFRSRYGMPPRAWSPPPDASPDASQDTSAQGAPA